jgi:myo-inositol 2-dehydrogenase/D-chiro-inositol 1-dehydrogenase
MSAETIRYGLIGAGMMGREHIRNLSVIPGSRIVAIADPNAESRRTAAELLHETPMLFDGADALLDSDFCDALIIASPNDTHAGLLDRIFSMQNPVPVLVEKPICTEPSDLERLRRGAAEYPKPIWVGMEYRYMPPVATLIKEVHEGRVGRPAMIAMREHRHPFMQKVDNWNRFSKRTGGTLVEKCCHFFDLMRFIARSEAVRVYASGAADFNHLDERYDGRQPDILDNAFVIVDFANGMRAHLDLCMFADGSWWQEAFAVTGNKAKIECLVPASRGYEEKVPAEVLFSPRNERKTLERRLVEVDEEVLAAGAHHGSTYYEHLGFRRAILGQGPVEVSVEDGLKAVAIGMAAELSVREKRAVEVDGLQFG